MNTPLILTSLGLAVTLILLVRTRAKLSAEKKLRTDEEATSFRLDAQLDEARDSIEELLETNKQLTALSVDPKHAAKVLALASKKKRTAKKS